MSGPPAGPARGNGSANTELSGTGPDSLLKQTGQLSVGDRRSVVGCSYTLISYNIKATYLLVQSLSISSGPLTL